MKIGKLIKWTVIVGAVVVLASIFLFFLAVGQQRSRVDEFSRANAAAPDRAKALLAPLAPTTAPLARAAAPAPPRPRASVTATTPTQFNEVLRDFSRKFYANDWPRRGNQSWMAANLGLGGMTLLLPAEAFPDEGTDGPLRAGPALRARIASEALLVMADDRRWQARDLRRTTASLARAFHPVMEHAAEILRSDWVLPDFQKTEINAFPYLAFAATAALAVLREGLRGGSGSAGELLERTLRADLLLKVGLFPARVPFHAVQRTLLTLAERGGVTDADLERVQRLLEAARLDERQLADLRAAHVMELEQRLMGTGEDRQVLVDGGHPPLMVFAEMFADRASRAFFMAQIRPAALAWAAGEPRKYWIPARRLLGAPIASPVYIQFCPPELAAFSPDAVGAANEDIDMTRLVVAAARRRLATGNWPGSIEELAAYGLSPFPVQGKVSVWAVDRITSPTSSSALPERTRPLFFRATRATLDPLQLRYTIYRQYGIGNEIVVDRSGITDRRRRGPARPLIIIRAIWPRQEDYPEGFLEALAEEGAKDRKDGKDAEGEKYEGLVKRK